MPVKITSSTSASSILRTKPTVFWPEQLAPEAFYGLAVDVVMAFNPHTEADSAAILLNFLIFIRNTVGPNPHAIAEAAKHRCNTNVALVNETSKSGEVSSQRHIRAPFFRVYSV